MHLVAPALTACKPIILGCAGPVLTEDEARFFKDINPFGFILFKRNCDHPDQVRDLVRALRESVGREDIPVFIDKEGGRVTRLRPPYWPALPSMRTLGQIYEKDPEIGLNVVRQHALITAHRLVDLGINGNCAPVLDLMIEGPCDVIGDRAFSADPQIVAACARVVVDTFLSCGVYPVIKHLPGHGRVQVDPHQTLPYVDTGLPTLVAEDFVPFIALKDAPMGMSCHVVFNALDPDEPASLSTLIHRTIYRGHLDFQGLILSDDLAMGAIGLPLESRARAVLSAGSDVALFCSGVLDESKRFATDLPDLSADTQERWQRARQKIACAILAEKLDMRAAEEELYRSLNR